MTKYIMISDAAKEVKVESHVLRYWEEELHLPIKRNELGHRYYTAEDIERFKQIKNMKERGLQLKAIKMILKDGQLDIIPQEDNKEKTQQMESNMQQADMPINIIQSRELKPQEEASAPVPEGKPETREEKARRLQWILQQLIKETLQENNQILCREVKESVLKELDYQFRVQEEREEERDRRLAERDEEYYKRMDELLRKKSGRLSMRDRRVERKKTKEQTRMERRQRTADRAPKMKKGTLVKENQAKESLLKENRTRDNQEKDMQENEKQEKENQTGKTSLKENRMEKSSTARGKRDKKRRHSIL